jgi:hypothetical protein
MSVYKDDIIQYLHDKIGDGHNVRHAIALTIDHFGERILTWSKVVVKREIEGSVDPRERDQQ